MKYLLLLYSLLTFLAATAQQQDAWIAYYESGEDYRFGFKNSRGEVMIPPRFMGFTVARKWDHIAALMEDSNGRFDQYYMLKDGTRFGKDSLYIFDMSFDCESEGYIKFKDPVTGNTGMFNAKGRIAIPPVYNDITSFRNGLAVALKGAHKSYWDTSGAHTGCNHWSWEGGQELLINQQHEVLVTGFPAYNDLDMYSFTISDTPATDNTRINFRGKDNKYYTFTDNLLLFKHFLEKDFLPNREAEQLLLHSYPAIIYWDEDSSAWKHVPKEVFIRQHYSLLSEKLALLQDTATNYDIFVANFLPIPDDMSAAFEHCYDNCGNWNTSRYPVYSVTINHYGPDRKFQYQDHLNFIKVNNKILFIGSTLHPAVTR